MKLRQYQQEAVNAAWRAIRQHNPLIVLPTGSGKSLVLAELCRRVVAKDGRCIVLAHRKELLEQNSEKIRALLPGMDVGIYSAGLKSRNTEHDVVVAGINSVYKRAVDFGVRQVIIVDEAHLVPNKSFGMYRQFISEMTEFNQWMRVIGLTATPFRLQDGPLCDGEIFDDICYSAPLRQLIDDGWLSNITSVPTVAVDITGVRTRAGEYIEKDLEGAFMRGDNVDSACRQIVEVTADRRSILIFGVSIAHCNAIQKCLESLGQCPEIVTSDTHPLERAGYLEAFKSGWLRMLINCNVLTTGFDAPNVDCVAIMRASQSAGLIAQIVGRGLRKSAGKTDCLVLDYGGNFSRHGSLDDPNYGMQARSSGEGRDDDGGDDDDALKVCPQCGHEQAKSNLWCEACDADFPYDPVTPNHEGTADFDTPVIGKKRETFDVLNATACRWPGKNGKTDTVRFEYGIDASWPRSVSEWICIEHEGWARSKAEAWWCQHCEYPCPTSIDDVVWMFDSKMLRTPSKLLCEKEGKYWSIIGREFDRGYPKPEEFVEVVSRGEEEEEAPF